MDTIEAAVREVNDITRGEVVFVGVDVNVGCAEFLRPVHEVKGR